MELFSNQVVLQDRKFAGHPTFSIRKFVPLNDKSDQNVNQPIYTNNIDFEFSGQRGCHDGGRSRW
jgi:hypothetical protein